MKVTVEKAPSLPVTVASNETLAGAPVGGVPCNCPAAERESQTGRLVEVQPYGDVPPIAARFCVYEAPMVAAGSGDVVVIAGGLTLRMKGAVAVFGVGDCESLTVTLKPYEPPPITVPLICPVLSIVSPEGIPVGVTVNGAMPTVQ